MIPYRLYESLCRRGQTRRSAPTDDRAVVGANLCIRPLCEDGVVVNVRGQTHRSAPTDDHLVVGANLRVRPLCEGGVMVRAVVGANLRVRPLRVRPIPLSRIVPL